MREYRLVTVRLRERPAATGSATRRAPFVADLALEGGGAHGTFARGVLDRLLPERVEFREVQPVSPMPSGKGALWTGMSICRIASEAIVVQPGYSPKLTAEGTFCCEPSDAGLRSVEESLDWHVRDVGKRSTSALDALLETI